jgi:hypothetical protein
MPDLKSGQIITDPIGHAQRHMVATDRPNFRTNHTRTEQFAAHADSIRRLQNDIRERPAGIN